MDRDRFDALARSLAAVPSRRSLLGLLLGVSSRLLGTRGAAADPGCRHAGRACTRDG